MTRLALTWGLTGFTASHCKRISMTALFMLLQQQVDAVHQLISLIWQEADG